MCMDLVRGLFARVVQKPEHEAGILIVAPPHVLFTPTPLSLQRTGSAGAIKTHSDF